MTKKIFKSHKDFEDYCKKEIGVTDYHTVTQEQINMFADATLDHQWIHTNPERAKKESPYKDTIAHGYLTLSLLKFFWDELIEVKNVSSMINYGIDKLKFNAPVVVNSRVRVRLSVDSAVNLRGISKICTKARMEIDGNKKPAFEGYVTFLFKFKE